MIPGFAYDSLDISNLLFKSLSHMAENINYTKP